MIPKDHSTLVLCTKTNKYFKRITLTIPNNHLEIGCEKYFNYLINRMIKEWRKINAPEEKS